MVLTPRRTTKTVRSQKAKKQRGRPSAKFFPDRNQSHEHGVDGFAADPGLNAEPATGDKGAENGGGGCARGAGGGGGGDRGGGGRGGGRGGGSGSGGGGGEGAQGEPGGGPVPA